MKNIGCLSIIAIVITAYYSIPVLFGPNEELKADPNDKVVVKECSLMKINTKKLKFEGAIKKLTEDQRVLYCQDSAEVNETNFFKVVHENDTGYLATGEFKQYSTSKYSHFWSNFDFQKGKIIVWISAIFIVIIAVFIKVRNIHKAFLSEFQ